MSNRILIIISALLLSACGASDQSIGAASAPAASAPEVSAPEVSTPAAAPLMSPVEGTCYDYTESDVDLTSAADKEVDCSESHTAEIYRVAIWPSETDPNLLTPDERWTLGNTVCQPWDGANGSFNYWAFYVPTSEEWDAGANWVRCDGMNAESTDPLVVTSWTGSLLSGTF